MAANVNSYIAAGNAAIENSYAALSAARDNAPKYDEIAKQGMKSRAEEKITAMKADAAVKEAQIDADTLLKKSDIKIDLNKSLSKSKKKTQFAGKIAAAGAVMATALMPSAEIIKPGTLNFDRSESRIRESLQSINKELEGLGKPVEKPKADTSVAPTAGATLNTNISASDRDVLNVLGRWESDGVGKYNAVNQIGIKGGRAVLPGSHSGDIRQMSQHGGRALTDFTVGEIMDLQNNSGANRSLSNREWVDSGRLHAVGRYQFIGPTFAAEVQRQGISRDSKFTPELQDQMALSHLRYAGSMRPWVGPSDHATPQERALVDQWFANQ